MSSYLFDIGTIEKSQLTLSSESGKFVPTFRITDDAQDNFEVADIKVNNENTFVLTNRQQPMTGGFSFVSEAPKKFSFVIGYVKSSLIKQIYAPCELDLTLSIMLVTNELPEGTAFEDILPRDIVAEQFIGKRVRMSSFGSSKHGDIVKDYYVETIATQYFFDAEHTGMQVLLRCYSPDKALTLNKYSKVYLGQKLGEDIFKEGLSYVTDNNFGLTIDGDQSGMRFLKYKTTDRVGLAYGNEQSEQEFIQPYLVQYNESFYDFLCRTAQRNGEYVFFEDGKFCLGIPGFDPKKPLILDRDYTSIIYPEISKNNLTVENYSRSYLQDGTQFASGSNLRYNFEQTNDDYADTELKKQTRLPSESKIPMANLLINLGESLANTLGFGPDISSFDDWNANFVTVFMNFLKGGFTTEDGATSFALNGFMASIWIDKTLIGYKKAINKRFNDEFFPGKNDSLQSNLRKHNAHFIATEQMPDDSTIRPFANGYTSEDLKTKIKTFYDLLHTTARATIRQNIEEVNSQTITLSYAGKYKHLKLGSVVQLSSTVAQKYVVTHYELTHDKMGPMVTIEIMPLKTLTYLDNSCSLQLPFPPKLHSVELIRKVSAQVAYVVDSDDPQGMGRVRIRYPWQGGSKDTKDDASPWIRMATPMASQGGGIYFAPHVGDEVMVDYEHGDIEQPFVIGVLYSADNKAPSIPAPQVDIDGSRKTTHNYAIKSVNGHSIYLNDESNVTNFMLSFSEGWKGIRFLAPEFTEIPAGSITNGLIGGMTLRDKYNMYNISMSSTDRSIKINSPLGNVSIGAFTGITINAPNGNVKIVGKNVDIKAGNKLTLTSGANIDIPGGVFGATYGRIAPEGSGFGMKVLGGLAGMANAIASSVIDTFIGGAVDLSFVRSIVETFVRPIDGTLQIKSKRYLELEAGYGKTNIPSREAYTEEKSENFTSLIGKINLFVKEIDKQVDKLCLGILESYNDGKKSYQDLLVHYHSLEVRAGDPQHPEEADQLNQRVGDFPNAGRIVQGNYQKSEFDNKQNLVKEIDLPIIQNAIEKTLPFVKAGEPDSLVDEITKALNKKAKALGIDYSDALAAIKLEKTDVRIDILRRAGVNIDFSESIENADIFADAAKFLKRKLAYQFIEPLIGRAVDRFSDLTHSILEKVKIEDNLRIAGGATITAPDEANLMDDFKWFNYVSSIRPGKEYKEWSILGNVVGDITKSLSGLKSSFTNEGGKWGAAQRGQILISDQLGVTTVLDRGIPKVVQDQENIVGLWDSLKNL